MNPISFAEFAEKSENERLKMWTFDGNRSIFDKNGLFLFKNRDKCSKNLS
jgi:hypothetical protein